MPTPSLKTLTLKVGEILNSETGTEMFLNHYHLPTISDLLLHFLHLQVSPDPPVELKMIRFFNKHQMYILNVLFYSDTTERLMEIWQEAGFDEKLLHPYKTVRGKVATIWKDASSAVFGKTQANRNHFKQKIVESLESIIDILRCR